MPDVAALQVVVNADTSGAERGLDALGTKVGGLGSAIQTALGAAAVGAVAGLGAAFVGSVKTAADFEKQMSAVGAVAGASAQEMEQLTKLALDLGKETSFSASEAAQGLEELVKAGVSVQDAIGGGAKAALDLAAAGAVSVAEAAEIASNAMNVFGLKGADMAHVADTIAGAANVSAISVNDYKFSLSAAGAVAATVGISFDSLSQAIAVMGNAGIKGSDAGTSLKTMMMNLIPTTNKQKDLFRELGILTMDVERGLRGAAEKGIVPATQDLAGLTGAMMDSLGIGRDVAKWTKDDRAEYEKLSTAIGLTKNEFFDATGNAKSFGEIAQVLQDALKGMTKEQQLATLEIMFGSDAIRAGAVLLKEGAAGFEEVAAGMAKVTAAQVAEERLNNLWGSVEKLKGSLETAAIILGGMFTPALKRMADGATDAVNVAIDALEQIPDAIETIRQVFAGDWAPAAGIRPFTLAVGNAAIMLRDTFGPSIAAASAFITDTLIPGIQAVAAPVAAFLAGFMSVIATAGLVTAAIAAVAAILAFLLSPLGLIAATVGALAAAWVTDFGGIQEKTAAVWAVLEPIFTAIVDWLGAKIPPVLAWLSETGWPALVTAAQAVAEFVTGSLIPVFTEIVTWLGEKIPPVMTWISETGWPALVAAGQKVYDIGLLIVQFFKDLWTELEKRGLIDQAKAAFDNLMTVLEPVFNVLSLIVGIAAQVLGFFGDLAAKGLESGAGVKFVADQLYRFFEPLADGLSTLAKLIGMLRDLGNIKMPSWWGSNPFGGGGGGPGGATQLSLTTGGGSSHVAPYLDLINQVSRETGVPADVLAALMEVEGSGAGSTSPAGARGLMQVMPNYVAPGENPFDPLTSIRQGARAVTEKYNATGSWQAAGRAYFGYGVDAGGMDTNTYGARYDAARSRYQQMSGPSSTGMMKTLPEGMRAPLDLMETVNQQFVPQWVRDMDTITQAGAQATATVSENMAATGAGLVTMSTDDLGNVTRIYSENGLVIGATITNTAGEIVNAWGTMAAAVAEQSTAQTAAVTEQANLMTSGALVSVTALGTGTQTVVSEMSGTTIATITDMQGQVTSQYAQLANGAQLQMGDMANGVLTSVTSMGEGMVTTVQDANGNMVSTVTDASGKVTSQYASMASEVGSSTREMASAVSSFSRDTARGFGAAADAAKKYAKEVKAAAEATKAAIGKMGGEKGGSDRDDNPFAKRAAGGPVNVGETYLVGEEGPELFSPMRSGTIIPNDALAAGRRGGDTYNFYGVVPETVLDRMGREQRKQELMYRIGG